VDALVVGAGGMQLGAQHGVHLLRLGGVATWRFMVMPAIERSIRHRIHSRFGDGEE